MMTSYKLLRARNGLIFHNTHSKCSVSKWSDLPQNSSCGSGVADRGTQLLMNLYLSGPIELNLRLAAFVVDHYC